MTASSRALPNETSPKWRFPLLLVVLGILIVVALRWGVMQYMLSAGQMALKQRNLAAASSWLERAKWWGDQGGEVAFYRSRLARVQGDLETAQALLDVAHLQGYNAEAVERERAMNLAQAGEPKPLMQGLHRSLSDETVDAGEAMAAVIAGLERNGQIPEAFQMTDFWLAADTEDPRLHYHRGRLLKLEEQWEPAAQSLSRAVQLAPQWNAARVALGEVEVARGEPSKGLQFFNDVLTADPQDFGARLGRADALLALKQYDQVIKDLEPFSKQYPGEYRICMALAAAALAQEQHQAALDFLQPLTKDFADDLALNERLTVCYEALGDATAKQAADERIAKGKESLAQLTEWRQELDKQRGSDYDWVMLCVDAIAPYQLNAALPFLSRAIQLRNDQPIPQRLLAKYYQQSGDLVTADSFRRSLRRINQMNQAKTKQSAIQAEQAKTMEAAQPQQ